jgi:hypothetical protein
MNNRLKVVEAVQPVLPSPPKGLSANSRAWWQELTAKFVLESHHLALLSQAALAMDRCERARKVLKAEDEYYVDLRGVRRAHPALAVLNQSAMLLAKLTRQLDLDTEPAPESHRRMPQLGRRGR